MNAMKLVGGTDTDQLPLPLVKPDGQEPSGHWLKDLGPNTIFLTKSALNKDMTESALMEFAVTFHSKKATRLLVPESGKIMWVDPIKFSRRFDLFEILLTPEEAVELAQKEMNNAQRSLVGPARVDNDAVLPGHNELGPASAEQDDSEGVD